MFSGMIQMGKLCFRWTTQEQHDIAKYVTLLVK